MRNSIRKRTFRYLLLSMVLIVVAFLAVVLNYLDQDYRAQYASAQLYMTEKTAETVEDLLRSMKQDAFYLCCSEALADALVNTEGTSHSVQTRLINEAFMMNTGTPTTPLLRYASAVLLVDRQFPFAEKRDAVFTLGGVSQLKVFSALSVCDDAWYKQTEAYNAEIYAFMLPEQPDRVFFSRLQRNFYLKDSRYCDQVGVVVYTMPAISLKMILQDDQMSDGVVSLMTFNGQVMACTDDALLQAYRTDVDTVLSNLPGKKESACARLNGKTYTITSRSVNERWQVVVLQPQERLWHSMRDTLTLLGGFGVVFVVMVLVISAVLSRRLSLPIMRLSNAMIQARKAQTLPESIPVVSSSDEIEYLYQSYNDIVENIHRISEKERQQYAQLRATELKALQSQINPHFIYNTLDSVGCIALMNGEEDIATMVTSLINILKYSIGFSNMQAELSEEVDYLQQYIQIQRLRYHDSFDFICEIQPEYGRVLVPKLMIQPLVENALFHAESQDQRLRIRVWCERDEAMFRIHVCDNGFGADVERMNQWLREGSGDEKFGIGIRNVNKRIQLMSSAEYGIHYALLADGGLDAVITLPYKLMNRP